MISETKGIRAFYTIKKSSNIDIPVRIWLKMFKSIIEPILLNGSEVWGPLINQDTHWKPCTLRSVRASTGTVHRNTPNNGCWAELSQFPLLIRIQKRAIKFYKHLKASDPNSYHYKALHLQEEKIERSPLSQPVLRLTSSGQPPHNLDQPNYSKRKRKSH